MRPEIALFSPVKSHAGIYVYAAEKKQKQNQKPTFPF